MRSSSANAAIPRQERHAASSAQNGMSVIACRATRNQSGEVARTSAASRPARRPNSRAPATNTSATPSTATRAIGVRTAQSVHQGSSETPSGETPPRVRPRATSQSVSAGFEKNQALS